MSSSFTDPAVLAAAYARKPGPLGAERLAKALLAQDRVADAEALLEEVVVRYPQRPRLLGLYLRIDPEHGGYDGVAERIAPRLRRAPRHPGLRARAALAAIAARDEAAAARHGRLGLAAAGPDGAALMRPLVADAAYEARLFGLGDQLLSWARPAGSDHADVVLDRLRGRLAEAGTDVETERLLDWLVRRPAHRVRALTIQAEAEWLADGPSPLLLDRLAALAPQHEDAAAAALSLAVQLGEHEVADALLTASPVLIERAGKLLPVAWVAAARTDNPLVHANCELFTDILNETEAFFARLADPAVAVAVVGNAPSERGRGRGPLIDAHDEVVRFNRYSTAEGHAPDYGRRTTIACRLRIDDPSFAPVAPGTALLLFRPLILFRPNGWSAAQALRARDVRIVAQPHEPYYALKRRLGAKPSSGITMLAQLHAMRGRLGRDDVFGFRLLGQTDPGSTHYTGRGLPSPDHDWAAEARLLDMLIG